MNLSLKRVYELPKAGDGQRILVDRIWPRGLTKEKAKIDLWLKEVAPSTKLRQWFGHDPARWPAFERKYRAELKGNVALDELKKQARNAKVTLVYAAKDEDHNNAVVLRAILTSRRETRAARISAAASS